MKKGFSIIEIIISISLIVIIGITSSIFVIKKNKSNIENITKEILEAGSLYLKLELDDNGNNYDKEIYNGAKGVKIPLSNLVSKGYIDESLKQSVIDYAGTLDNDKDYYVMFIENNEYCDENQIVGLSSWMEKGDDIYLCDDYSSNSGTNENANLIDTILNDYGSVETLNIITNDNYYWMSGGTSSYYGANVFYSKENGLYKKEDGTYYFRGSVGDNYVMLFNELYRILSFKDNKIKLIQENALTPSSDLTTYGDIKPNFNNSGIKNALENYLNGSVLFSCYYHYGTCNILTTDKFCDEIRSEDQTSASNTCNGEELELDVGLITASEAIYAGVPLKVGYSEICSEVLSSGCYGEPYTSNSWLTSGASTMTMSTSSKTNSRAVHYFLSNALKKQSHTGTLGIFVTGNFSYYKSLQGIAFNNLRPVIVIDSNYLTVTGKGTQTNPYVIN